MVQSTNKVAFQQSNLDNYNQQNESAYTALRTHEINLNQDNVKFVFYASFAENQPAGNDHLLIDLNELHKRYATAVVLGETKKLEPVTTILPMTQVLAGDKLTEEELDQFFPKKLQVEKKKNRFYLSLTQMDRISFYQKRKKYKIGCQETLY